MSPNRHLSELSRQELYEPSGNLTFTFKTERYGSHVTGTWSELPETSLEEMLAQVVKAICEHYIKVQKQRQEEAAKREQERKESEERWRKQQEEEVIRKQEKARQDHAETLETVIRSRKDDLLKAAEWWRLHQIAQEFISVCEQRWRSSQSGELKPEQEEWLQWARENAEGLSPFATGYPEPDKDGAFDPALVSFGGPYPASRNYPRPPTMPELPKPVMVQRDHDYAVSSCQPASKPYPFWLKYPRK